MRPIIEIVNTGKKTALEEFQNAVLRPILKMRNDELIGEFINYRRKNDLQLDQLKDADKEKLIFELLKTKPKLFEGLVTYICTEFSLAEKTFYLKHKKELNKRLKEMMGQRLAQNLAKIVRNDA